MHAKVMCRIYREISPVPCSKRRSVKGMKRTPSSRLLYRASLRATSVMVSVFKVSRFYKGLQSRSATASLLIKSD